MSDVILNMNEFEKKMENDIIELNNTNFMYFEKLLKQNVELGFIQKIQTLNTNNFYLKIKLRKDKENKELIIGNGYLTISNLKTESKSENKGFSLILNNKLEGKQIKSISQINLEKILLFEFLEYKLYCEFFSNNNIILTDKENNIVACLIKEEWKDRKIKLKEKYILPKNESKNIFEFDEKNISKIINFDINKNLVSNIISNININPYLIEKYLEHYNISKIDFEKKDLEKIILNLKKIYEKQDIDNLIYLENKNKIYFFNLNIPFGNKINNNLNNIIDEYIIKRELFKEQNNLLNEQNKNIKNILHIINEQNKAREKIETKSKKSKDIGDLIYSNFEYFDECKKIINKLLKEKKDFDYIKNEIKKLNNKYNTNFEFKKIDAGKQKIVFLKQ